MAVLSARAAEVILFGPDELSSITMSNTEQARQTAQKLVVVAGMHENPRLGPRTISWPGDNTPGAGDMTGQFIPPDVSMDTLSVADHEMERVLHTVRARVFFLFSKV